MGLRTIIYETIAAHKDVIKKEAKDLLVENGSLAFGMLAEHSGYYKPCYRHTSSAENTIRALHCLLSSCTM